MSAPYWSDDRVQLYAGDCLDVLRDMPDNSVDAVVTDPPAGIAFMSKEWDHHKGGRQQWIAWLAEVMGEALRVTKPGGHAFVWALPRTSHWTATAIEDAGWDIRDCVVHLFGSGFPKSLDVSKAIDKARDDRHDEALAVTVPMREAMHRLGVTRRQMNAACGLGDSDAGSAQSWTTGTADGAHKPRVPTVEQWAVLRDMLELAHLDAEVWRLNGRKGTPGEAWGQREVTGDSPWTNSAHHFIPGEDHTQRVQLAITAPATDDARTWQGWGTSLKPASEHWWLARKPLAAGTVASNVLTYGTGALNIDGCRVGTEERVNSPSGAPGANGYRLQGGDGRDVENARRYAAASKALPPTTVTGRWPPNVLLGGDDVAAELDQQSGMREDGVATNRRRDSSALASDAGWGFRKQTEDMGYGGEGGASRFFPVFGSDGEPAPSVERPELTTEGRDDGGDAGPVLGDGTTRTDGPVVFPTFKYSAKAPTTERPRTGTIAHPTVKPLDLMRWLVRLVTPPGGTILDPFAGSGTTGEAAVFEHFHAILIEREPDYLPLIVARLSKPMQVGLDFGGAA